MLWDRDKQLPCTPVLVFIPTWQVDKVFSFEQLANYGGSLEVKWLLQSDSTPNELLPWLKEEVDNFQVSS